MANQTITVDSNHDDLVGRTPSDNITITLGATLTLDSMPHLTPMGILGVITTTDGVLHVDGTRTYELAYSGGTGGLPAILDVVTWNGGADTGKVVRLNSGTAAAGVMTVTVAVGSTSPVATDALVSGGWSATCDASKLGYLILYMSDSDWLATDARSTIRINGGWYELGVGDGTDGQVFTLPHEGHQPAVWVETGAGTDVFEIWHRVNVDGGGVFLDPDDFGNTFESGFVFSQVVGSSTLTFYNSVNGGVPPSGARIRIPSVHTGTTTLGAPTVEINSAVVNNHGRLVPANTNTNIEFDHLNASSCVVDFRGTNEVVITDSCWGISTLTTTFNKVSAPILVDNCHMGCGGTANYAVAALSGIGVLDNIGGITFRNVVVFCGTTSLSSPNGLLITTSSNIAFEGVCKIVSSRQNENTARSLASGVTTNVTAETLICLGAPLLTTAGCANWRIDTLIYGLAPGRGPTEINTVLAASLAGTANFVIRNGRLATGGAKHGTGYIYILTDVTDVFIYNHGTIDAKIDGEGAAPGVFSATGTCVGVTLKRIWYTNLSGNNVFAMQNGDGDLLFENCSGGYSSRLELDANRTLVKGMHGASEAPDHSTAGVEGDLVNVVGTCFLDYFKSDTTGALGLVFNDRGTRHLADVEITAGTPLWNGLADLLMRTTGDQVVYTWPYWIKGHTGFDNLPLEVVSLGSYDFEYDLDTGAGFSGVWKTINGANLSAEVISPAGFRFKVRITLTADGATNYLKGFAVRTTTTLAAQAANLYPLEVFALTVTGLKNPSEVRVFDAANPTVEIGGAEVITGGTFTMDVDPTEYPLVNVAIITLGYLNQRFTDVDMTSATTLAVQQQRDRQYGNP